MIKSEDYKILIRFSRDGQPYYSVFRKDDPYELEKEDYRELESVFTHLSLVIDKYLEKIVKEEKLSKVKANLQSMSKEDAMSMLSDEGKRLWVEVHNATGNCYHYCDNGEIVGVPMEGVWK